MSDTGNDSGTGSQSMEIGMIGLGRMGSNLARRLTQAGHRCVAYDVNPEAAAALEDAGVTGAATVEKLVAALSAPRAIWVMIPAAYVQSVVAELSGLLDPGDVIIDGGNSNYRDDIARHRSLQQAGIGFVDCGTSGGVWGLERGYSLMIGGDPEYVQRLDPIFKAIAPGRESAPATPGRTADSGTAPDGYHHCGPAGAGHFVKMVHNGVEYGMMSAIAEGLSIIKGAGIGLKQQAHDAETTPLRDPDAYRYEIDIPEVAEVWRRGTVISSWLIDLVADALARDGELTGFEGRVSDSGEGRWTAIAAIEEGIPAPVITTALQERFASRDADLFTDRVLSAMRSEFGGHAEKS
ncbi:MAG: decarboxylating 6-phosphogluconate dehydrogenase [Acidimicrobiia bacterium]